MDGQEGAAFGLPLPVSALLLSGFDVAAMSPCRFPPPWQVEQTPGGFKVLDASGQALIYVYARETANEANIAGVLTFNEARRRAVNVAKLPELLRAIGVGSGQRQIEAHACCS
jgi:hypothetical protein